MNKEDAVTKTKCQCWLRCGWCYCNYPWDKKGLKTEEEE